MSDFIIPVARADLLKRLTPNAYVVNEVAPARQLRTQLSKCQRIFSAEGHTYILRAFDVLFSVLHEWYNVPSDTKEEAWHIALKGCEICVRQLVPILESSNGGNPEIGRSELSTHRNALKMHVYLLCQFVDMFENELNAHAKSDAVVKVGRGRGRGGAASRGRSRAVHDISFSSVNLSMDWIGECEKAMGVLDQLCRLQLNKLWDPPVAEEDFVNLPANCCYKLLENRAMASSVNMRIAMTRLLTSLIRRYGHSISCCVKLTQLLQCFPHMVNCLLAFVRAFMDEENVSGVVRELLKEICSYKNADLERDTQTTQNFASFLLDVSSAYPALAQSVLPLLRPRLDEDPYQMRNCVLGVIGEVLSSFASREQLDPKESLQRDRLMDLLQEHIHDVNGYVRAKALQIWHAIVSTRGLPVRRQSQLAMLLVGPLGAMMDVSSFARRYACKTLTTMVLQSPATKLTAEELQRVLNKEIKRLEGLEDLLSKVCPYEDNEDVGPPVLRAEDEELSPVKKRSKRPKRKLRSRDLDSNSGDTNTDGGSDESSFSDNEESADMEENLERPPPIDGAECDAAAALEAAIHSAATIASQTPSSLPRTPLRSNSVAHAELSAEVQRQRACVAYLKETSAFSSFVQLAIRDFQAMLSSKTLTDVTEAIDFFVTAKHAGVQGLDAGIQQIFVQIWSQDEPIRRAVMDAFRRLYLQIDPDEPLGSNVELSTEIADVIVTNLTKFIHSADMGGLVSMERIIQGLTSTDQLNPSLSSHFWRRFVISATQDNPESREDTKSMLLILKMMVKSGPREFETHLDTLIQYGLEAHNTDPSKVDLERVKFTCDVLQRMIPRIKTDKTALRTKGSNGPFRLPIGHPLFGRLRSILISTVTQSRQNMWIPMMEQVIGTIYDLAESPDISVLNAISTIAERLIRDSVKQQNPPPQLQPENPAASNTEQVPVADEDIPLLLSKIKEDPEKVFQTTSFLCPSFVLSRFLSLAGHACLKQLVHLESSVLNELKRRAVLREEQKNKAKPKSRKSSRMSTVSVANSTISTANAQTTTVDEETGLVGAAADDAEADYIRQICDNELLNAPNHFFTPLLNLVTHVCSNPSRYADDAVQASASLALAKMMLVNTEVCEPRLQLLFTMAERSTSEIVRANLIVALGDLCRRFPNLLEPWTPNLYARLRDPSSKVRTNALNTLSHLILNDMVKVKGQISEMTVCLIDEIDRLNVLARQFFTELAQKGTALYNVIPDIISRLSDPDVGVSEEHFHSIMEFLLPLIGRERLCETLVEKICVRFRTTRSHRQWRDLAFCLTVISFNERAMRVLYENIPSFADKLCLPEIFAAFELLLTSAKKFTKPDGMARLEEFEAKVKEFHQKGVADEAAVRRAELAAKALKQRSRPFRQSSAVVTGAKQPLRRNLRLAARSCQPVICNDDDVADSEVAGAGPSHPKETAIRGGRASFSRRRFTGRSKRKGRVVFSSDEEMEERSDSDIE